MRLQRPSTKAIRDCSNTAIADSALYVTICCRQVLGILGGVTKVIPLVKPWKAEQVYQQGTCVSGQDGHDLSPEITVLPLPPKESSISSAQGHVLYSYWCPLQETVPLVPTPGAVPYSYWCPPQESTVLVPYAWLYDTLYILIGVHQSSIIQHFSHFLCASQLDHTPSHMVRGVLRTRAGAQHKSIIWTSLLHVPVGGVVSQNYNRMLDHNL